ncbi:MAG: hypothetical protein DMD60_01990 [Gemmatimonadetes bacterium]|nr:MAG: hypothetical protein DMD60_01990 [Gemmatimonadota bacterium]
MRRMARRQASLYSLLLLCALAPLAAAQGRGKVRQKQPTEVAPVGSEGAGGADSLNNLKFRNLGPSVAGGRVAAVVGVPGDRNLYYAGPAAGGVWKTIDGGDSWEAVFKEQPTASIGAIALAPSNPNVVWVGTGEGNPRNDVVDGRGVFMSPDAAKTWQFMGLRDVGQITRIVIDPTNPDVVLVAALGHVWGPNPERGVFRTTDGGKTWQKVLFVNDTTGATDLIMVPGNPRLLFAGMWQFVRYPWELVSGGAGSGIYRSKDGGVTWERLSEGLPPSPLGRIAVAAAATSPSHVYALVETKQGMLWDSKDQGDHWTKVSDFHGLSARPFYFSLLHVSPVDDRKVFFSSYLLLRSDDGGKTTTPIDRGVHVDHHALWIDPQNPDRMIQGNDGGVYVTENGARSWRFLNNLPIGQFYMVAADNNTPYMLCGGLQDNNAWCGPSSGVAGGGGGGGGGGGAVGLNGSEWFTVTGGDGEYAVPAPSDSSILYVDSQNGNITRVDLKTGVTRAIRPYLSGVTEMKPANLKYRFNWTSPIAVSPRDANTVYLGGNVVFKTTDGGEHWATISPDLTRNDKSKQVTSGGPINYDISGAETYNTILTVNLAPTDSNVIWVGTDDGLVQVTRDGGKTWTNVSGHFPGMAKDLEGRVYQIGISPFDPGAAYIAIDRHQLDDRHLYVYKTGDYGKTWTDIGKGLPPDVPGHVVRENPNVRGFLVLGTDAALWYSRDGGASWKPLRPEFPTVPVYDLQFVKRSHDLVIATHGRGLFVLDNITPLEELTPEVVASDVHVFSTLPAQIRVRPRRSGMAPTRFTTPNAPAGAVIDYYLKAAVDTGSAGSQGEGERGRSRRGRVIVTVTDSRGDTVVVDSTGPGKQGVNRYVWNLRHAGPTRLNFERPTGAEEEENPFRNVVGPRAVPGMYTVTVAAGGRTATKTVTVEPDPILGGDPARFAAQLRAGLEWRNAMSALNEMLNRVVSLETQLKNTQQALRDNAAGDTAAAAPVTRQGRELGRKLKELKDSLYNSDVQRDAGQDDIHYLNRFQERLQGLGFGLALAYAQPPNEVVAARLKELRTALADHVAKFNELVRTDVAAFNKTAQERQAPILVSGAPIEVREVKVVSR